VAEFVALLVAGGHHVVATTRTRDKLIRLRSMEAEPILMNGLDSQDVVKAVMGALDGCADDPVPESDVTTRALPRPSLADAGHDAEARVVACDPFCHGFHGGFEVVVS
jgi:hypothetical protein